MGTLQLLSLALDHSVVLMAAILTIACIFSFILGPMILLGRSLWTVLVTLHVQHQLEGSEIKWLAEWETLQSLV